MMFKTPTRWIAAGVLLAQMLVLLSPAAFAAPSDSGDIPVDAVHFPDEAFRNWISDSGNLNGAGSDGTLTQEERSLILKIDVTEQGIGDLTGIEYFPALSSLTCTRNNLTKLDVSKNPLLTELYCSSNQLASLDLSGNPELKHVYCASNVLTSLNLTNCAKLESLNCEKNRLASLDLSGNPALLELYSRHNQLTQLDVSRNTKLKFIETFDNQLTSFDCTMLPDLEFLHIDYNNLTTLDMSRVTKLQSNGFVAANNQLNTLTMPNIPDRTIEASVFYEQNPKKGYETVRWFNDPQYTQEIEADQLVPADGRTIYAKWVANPYTVSYNANGGKGEIAPQSVEYDQTFKLSPNTFTRTGYTFRDWNTYADGVGGRTFTDEQEVVNLAGESSNKDRLTLYAQWTANTYTIAYEANGGEGRVDSTKAVYDQSVALAGNQFTRPDFVFSGWSLTPGDSNRIDYMPGESVKNLTAENNHTVTLYAVWMAHADIQQGYLDQLTDFFRAYQTGDYYPEDWASLQSVRHVAEQAISGAGSDEAVMQQALQTAVSSARQVPTKAWHAGELARIWQAAHSGILSRIAAPLPLDQLSESRTQAQAALTQATADWLAQQSVLTDQASRDAAAQAAQAQLASFTTSLGQMQRAIGWLDSVKDVYQTPLGSVRSADAARFAGYLTAYNALASEEKVYCDASVANQLTVRKEFAEEKQRALQSVDACYASLTLTSYTEANQKQLTQIRDQAKTNIEAAGIIGAADRLALEAVANLKAVQPIVPQKAPSVTVKPTASSITKGQKLGDSLLTGGQADTEGTFTWKDGSVVPAQSGAYAVVFTPKDGTAYRTIEFYVTVTVTEPAPSPAPQTPSAPSTPTPSAPSQNTTPNRNPAPAPGSSATGSGSKPHSAGSASSASSGSASSASSAPASSSSASKPASSSASDSVSSNSQSMPEKTSPARSDIFPILIAAACAVVVAVAIIVIIRKRR